MAHWKGKHIHQFDGKRYHAACLIDHHGQCPGECARMLDDPKEAYDRYERTWFGPMCQCPCHEDRRKGADFYLGVISGR